MKTKKIIFLSVVLFCFLFFLGCCNAQAQCSGECVPANPPSCSDTENFTDPAVDCGTGMVFCVPNDCAAECVPANPPSCSDTENYVDPDVNCGDGMVYCVPYSTGPSPDESDSPSDESPVMPVKCDPKYFREAGGVCFPIGTGLSEASITDILRNLLMWILGIFGFLAILAFVISGIQYLVSAGDEKMIETAKRNMKWSLVGVVVALSGFIIILAVTVALQALSPRF